MRTLLIVLSSVVLTAGVTTLATQDTGQAAEHRFINLPGRTDNNPYSNAVLVGDTLYLAGDIGTDPETGRPPADVKDEVRILMDRMKQRLAIVDMTMDDLVMVEVHCPDLSLYDEFNDIYRTYFNDHFPARAFLGSGPLLLGGRFEITGKAVRQ